MTKKLRNIIKKFIELCERHEIYDKVGSTYGDAMNYLKKEIDNNNIHNRMIKRGWTEEQIKEWSNQPNKNPY